MGSRRYLLGVRVGELRGCDGADVRLARRVAHVEQRAQRDERQGRQDHGRQQRGRSDAAAADVEGALAEALAVLVGLAQRTCKEGWMGSGRDGVKKGCLEPGWGEWKRGKVIGKGIE